MTDHDRMTAAAALLDWWAAHRRKTRVQQMTELMTVDPSRGSIATWSFQGVCGRWPMLSPETVSGATGALRCLWHEICVDERTNR
eukprot:3221504-Prymnesium_polylepis.1